MTRSRNGGFHYVNRPLHYRPLALAIHNILLAQRQARDQVYEVRYV